MSMHPKTHTRPSVDANTSDGKLLQRVRASLASTGYPQLQEIRASVHEGFVALRGCVATYHQKQVAQEAAKSVDGVEILKNEIVVR
ncbi:MAG: BON domain-containing protein [Planctomycetaceae bacterium]|jgi:osmotically-inducible protein OsmY|nr:BON domain-containing protein [Planctomycetaceae bacterium]